MLTSTAALKAYFRQLADEHVALASFVYGSSERILARVGSNIDYPCLWMTVPDKVKLPDGRQQYSFSLWVLTNARQDYDEEEAAMDATETIADNLYERLREDARFGEFDFGKTQTVFQPKPRFSGDNDQGWVLDLDITLGDSGCYDPAKFGQ